MERGVGEWGQLSRYVVEGFDYFEVGRAKIQTNLVDRNMTY